MSDQPIAMQGEADKVLDEPGVVIRVATATDRAEFERVLLDAYGEYEDVLSEELWSAYKTSILHAIDEAETIERLVAERNGELVGSVFIYANSEKAYGQTELGIDSPIIRLLAVTRQARGLGVATALIRASAQWASAIGAETLHLHTSDIMQAAVRLYEHLGFERAYDKEFSNGNVLVKSYRVRLATFL